MKTIGGRNGWAATNAHASAALRLGIAGVLLLALPGGSEADFDDFCSQTARTQLEACRREVRDGRYTEKAICINIPDTAERNACLVESRIVRGEGLQLCREQFDARDEVCELLGEDRYAPDFSPGNFDDDFTNLTNPNPYFPLRIGNRWEYAGGNETVTVEVLNQTKLIEGVTCIVVNDLVKVAGKTKEDTDDWYGQRKDGTVDYCGESVTDFETFAGDNPEAAELVSIEGSWKTGRDGAKPGIRLPGAPNVGNVHRQEFFPGDAEDLAEVLSTTYGFGANPQLDAFVPQALAQLLCANDCVVTREFTPIEPGADARKYYARGIGQFLEVKPDTGEVVQLTDCNFDPKCAALPAP